MGSGFSIYFSQRITIFKLHKLLQVCSWKSSLPTATFPRCDSSHIKLFTELLLCRAECMNCHFCMQIRSLYLKLQTTVSCLIACNCRLEWAGCTIYQVFFPLFSLEHSLVNLYLVALAEISSIITKKNIATVQLYVVMKVSHMDESFGGGRHGTDTDGPRTPSSLHVVFYTMLTANWLY